MTKVLCEIDCENSPRATMLRDFNIAFASGDGETILAQMSDDIRWEMIGHKVIEGKTAAAEAMKDMLSQPADEIEIKSIITHGASASCDGVMRFPGDVNIAFSDVYEFTSASSSGTIKSMRSYGVDVK
jgi:hypothetical protein